MRRRASAETSFSLTCARKNRRAISARARARPACACARETDMRVRTRGRDRSEARSQPMPNDQVMDKKNKLAKVPRDVLKSMSNMGAKNYIKVG